MNEKQYLELLSQYAEWDKPGNLAVNLEKSKAKPLPRPPSYTEAELAEMSDEEAQAVYDQWVAYKESLPNETLAPRLLKVKHKPVPCEDCGKIVEGRRVEAKLCVTGHPHWRKTCKACELTINPYTGVYDVPSHQIQQVYVAWTRNKGKYNPREGKQSKIQQIQEQSNSDQFTYVENGDNMIIINNDFIKDNK